MSKAKTQHLRLQHIGKRIQCLETKVKRAKTILANLAKQRKYYEHALAKVQS